MNIKYIKTTDNKKYDLRDKRITDTDTGVATQSANGLLSSGDKKKLDGVASGAEVNQNAFSNIKIGNTTIAADGKTDTVELTAGNNITLTPDATNDKITIAATNTNTTYTFKGGTNQFTVTPSNGTAQTVSVTPSIANNVTGSDLTTNRIILGYGNSSIKASTITIENSLRTSDNLVPTSKAVKDAINALPEPMIFKGTLGKDGTITSLPAAASGNNGFTYKVITDDTYASQSAKIGDVFISNGSSWNLIPSGDEPSGTVTNILQGVGIVCTPNPITSSGTISHADTSSQASVSNSGRTYILSITLDSMGHVTGIASATETVTNTDTKVTQHLYTGDGKMPLLFATEQYGYPADITSIVYRNDSICASPSDGYIFANRFIGSSTHAETSSQSGSIGVNVNVASYWGKLWEIDVKNYFANNRDVTFLLQSAYNSIQGTLHVNIRQNGLNGSGAYNLHCNMRLTSGNIPRDRLRLYYNNSTGNCQLWYNCANQYGVINAKILHKTGRVGKEVQSLGTLYDLNANTEQTLPGTGYEYVESVYAVYSEWNDIQNKPSSKSEASGGTDVSLVTTGEKYTWNHKSNLALGNTASTALAGNTKYAGSSTQGGAATSAEKLTNTSNIGNTNQPVYFTTSGVPTAISYTINKSVPSNAVFTDTHYITHLYAGSGTAANAATTNGNTKLTVVDNTTTRNSVTIKGTGGTTVMSDANGVVTIDSVNKNSKWFNFYSPSKVDNAYYFIISPIGSSTVTPNGTCYSIEINAVVQSSSGTYIISNTKFVTWCYWYANTAGLRITYPVYSNSRIPIYYHNKAEGDGIGNETGSSNVCNIPIKVENVELLAAVNIKVDGLGVSDCICTRSYSSFNWGQDEPTSWSAI